MELNDLNLYNTDIIETIVNSYTISLFDPSKNVDNVRYDLLTAFPMETLNKPMGDLVIKTQYLSGSGIPTVRANYLTDANTLTPINIKSKLSIFGVEHVIVFDKAQIEAGEINQQEAIESGMSILQKGAVSLMLMGSVIDEKTNKRIKMNQNWLAHGIDDKSFIVTLEILVFQDLYTLISYLRMNILPQVSKKTITDNRLLKAGDFVFNTTADKKYYYCSKDQKIKSSKYLQLHIQENTYEIVKKFDNNPFCFPIIEIKNILVD